MPGWVVTIALISLIVSIVCALAIVIDLAAGHPQRMWIMNVVWPITALYAGPLALWGYFTVGRLSTKHAVQEAKERGEEPPNQRKPFWQKVGVGATHCGAGCTLGDLVVESFLAFVPLTLFGRPILAAWTLDYALAFVIGIAFQYFTIVPMRHLSVGQGIWAALKADALSLTAWQVGMYGWMALVVFVFVGHELDKGGVVFWFMMQIAMLAGFLTAYPVNWLLLRTGLKEAM